MLTSIPEIPMREVLHFLGWRGNAVEEQILAQIRSAMDEVHHTLEANVITRCFERDDSGNLRDTVFNPRGNDINSMLSACDRVILLAATLGSQSERLLLRHQARDSADALIMDAVLSAAIESVCDAQERILREEYKLRGLYLTDRFSPGYGDMPISQTKEICAVLQTDKSIGLTVSGSGIMIPRKSVTAVLGVSPAPQKRRPSACALCNMNKTCPLREMK